MVSTINQDSLLENNDILKDVKRNITSTDDVANNDINFILEKGNIPEIAQQQSINQSLNKKKRKIYNENKSALIRHQASPNKFGIQPLGNLFMLPEGEKSDNETGLGIFNSLGEDKLIMLLQLLEPETIAKMSLLSKSMWIYCTQEEVWKNLVCARLAKDYPNGVPKDFFNNYKGWRQLYHDRFIDNDMTGVKEHKDLLTIKCDRFYSDVLYMAHQCSTIPLDELFDMNQCTIDKVENISLKDFIQHYEEPGLPVVLKGLTKDWSCMNKWNFHYFKNNFGDKYFQAECLTLPFSDYYNYMNGIPKDIGEESSLYLFDRHFAKHASKLYNDYDVPEYFNEDLFQFIGDTRPDYRWVIMGPKRSGSTFHIDPNGTSAWNACVIGRKKWVMYPPGCIPPGVYPTSDNSEVTSPISVAEWFLQYYKAGSAYECVVEPGEIMFVPRGWWHTVINLDDSIAITQNYVSTQTLRFVMDFVRDDSLVSGYPGNNSCSANGLEDEATLTKKMNQDIDCCRNSHNNISLREALREALIKHKPGLLKKTKVFEDEEQYEYIQKQKKIDSEKVSCFKQDDSWSGFNFDSI